MAKPIDRLTIRGFKSIKTLEDLALANLNILIGANGAGKSNFISFFTLLRNLVQQELELAVAKHGGADVHLYRGPKVTRGIAANLHFGDNWYEFELQPTTDGRLVFGKEVAGFRGDFGPSGIPFGQGHREAKLKDHKDDAGVRGGRGVASYVHESVTSWTA